jgi:hypothetical protein
VSQWVWNLRLELGHQLGRLLCARSLVCSSTGRSQRAAARHLWLWQAHGCRALESWPLLRARLCPPARRDVALSSQSDTDRAHERRKEADGSLRVVYAASIRSCRPCPLREQCQWNGSAPAKPRQVSVLLHPLVVGSAPLL